MKRKFLSFSLIFVVVCLFVGLFVPLVSAVSYSVTFASTEGGHVYGFLDDGTYYREGTRYIPSGTHLRIEAQPMGGYIFDHWEFVSGGVNGTTTVNPINTVISSGFILQAYFVASDVEVDVLFEDGDNGSVVVQWDGVTHLAGNYSIEIGTYVTVTALPDAGYYFYCFGNGVDNASRYNPKVMLIGILTDGITITPYFLNGSSADTYFVTIASSSGGTLGVSYTPSGESFPVSVFDLGTYQVAYGSVLTFDAVAFSGSTFRYLNLTGVWNGIVEDNHFSIDVDGNLTVTAVFEGWSSFEDDDDAVFDWDVFEDFSQMAPFVQVLFLFLLVLAPPMLVITMMPKVGMVGFMGTLVCTLTIAIFVFSLPLYFMVFTFLGVGLMMLSALRRD